MAYVLVNKDGTSDAKVGDLVVTGGGIYEKTAAGSKFISGLDVVIDKAKSGSYGDVLSAFSLLSNKGAVSDTPVAAVETVTPTSVDDNGIVSVAVDGYDPNDYAVATSSSSAGISNIVGYVVLGLVGIALLDRFMNKR